MPTTDSDTYQREDLQLHQDSHIPWAMALLLNKIIFFYFF